MTLLDRITVNPNTHEGQPYIRGLSYTVEMLLDLLASDMGIDEILAAYKDLERDDILAVLIFASRLSQLQHQAPSPA